MLRSLARQWGLPFGPSSGGSPDHDQEPAEDGGDAGPGPNRPGETPFDPHHFYPAGWVGRALAKSRPTFHADIGSRATEVALLSAMVSVTIFVVPRPLHVRLPGLVPVAGDLTRLPLPDKSMVSVSSLHVIGQAGSDAGRDLKVLGELQRLLGFRGSLYLSVPVGRERIRNGQRVFAPQTIVVAVPALRLRRFSFAGDDRVFHVDAALEKAAKLDYGCGLFEFERS